MCIYIDICIYRVEGATSSSPTLASSRCSQWDPNWMVEPEANNSVVLGLTKNSQPVEIPSIRLASARQLVLPPPHQLLKPRVELYKSL